jgi:cytochrome P450
MEKVLQAAPGIPKLCPVRVLPPEQPLGRLGFVSRFVRNPLLTVPGAAYEEDIVVDRGAPLPLVWITAPALVKTVLLDESDAYRKQSQIRLLGPLLGKGILTSEGADWKWQRQASAPMFRQQDLLGFVPVFVRATEELVARWRGSAPGSVHMVDRDMTGVTFDVISATLLPSADRTVAPAVERAIGMFQKSGSWAQLYAMAKAPAWLPRPGRRTGEEAIRLLRNSVLAIIAERRASGKEPDDLMHRLMVAHDPETGRTMNDEQLVDNLLTFYLAGHETTAKALTWTLHLLSRQPEWAAALAEEIQRVTGGAPVAGEHIEQLVLVQQVIKESMRLFPPVPLMTRQAAADTTLGGVSIRKGTSVIMPIYAMQRHARRWVEPHLFDPQRFAPENEAKIPRYQYMPFGAGPRICIGMAFAMIEATAMLSTMLQRARFEPGRAQEPAPVARVTLLPRGGMPLRVLLH